MKRDAPLLAGLEADALEAAQLPDRRARPRRHVAHVELHHLVAVAGAGVLHVERDLEAVARARARVRDSRRPEYSNRVYERPWPNG